MSMLSECDMASIADTVLGTLNQTVESLVRPVRSVDGMGGQATAWNAVTTPPIPCRIKSVRLRYENVNERIVTITSSDLVVGLDAPLMMGDRAVVGGDVWHVDGVPVYAPATKTYGVTLIRP